MCHDELSMCVWVCIVCWVESNVALEREDFGGGGRGGGLFEMCEFVG